MVRLDHMDNSNKPHASHAKRLVERLLGFLRGGSKDHKLVFAPTQTVCCVSLNRRRGD